MEVLVFLVPLAILLGGLGLTGFLWSLKSGQYEDLDGAAWRAIMDDEPERSPDSRQDPACNRDAGPGEEPRPVCSLAPRAESRFQQEECEHLFRRS
jgi:cbb3-type cytochrome oxidase maturation protein